MQQLLRSGASVTLCLCCDGLERGLPVFDTARETARALLREAAQAGQRVFVRQVAPARNDEILFAARHLFAPGGAAWSGKASCVHLRRFDGPFAQAQAVAATILQLLRQGFRYREIAVAAADDPAGRTVLQTVLRQYGSNPAWQVSRGRMSTCLRITPSFGTSPATAGRLIGRPTLQATMPRGTTMLGPSLPS